MAPQTWATPKQHEFLMSKQAECAAAKEAGANALREWRTQCYQLFFQQWPSQNAEEEEIANSTDPHVKAIVNLPFNDTNLWAADRRKKLKVWFNNHPLGKRKRGGTKEKVVISVNPTISRLPSEKNIYSKVFFKDRVKALVDLDPLSADSKMRLSVINKLTHEAYMNESDEVKAEVKRLRDQRKMEMDLEMASLEGRSETERLPEEYATSIERIPELAHDFMQQVSALTGWSFTVLAGGPDPNYAGEIMTMSVHSRHNPCGLSFGKAYPKYDTVIRGPFSDFLHTCYPMDVRKSRALPGAHVSSATSTSSTSSFDIDGSAPSMSAPVGSVPVSATSTSIATATSTTSFDIHASARSGSAPVPIAPVSSDGVARPGPVQELFKPVTQVQDPTAAMTMEEVASILNINDWSSAWDPGNAPSTSETPIYPEAHATTPYLDPSANVSYSSTFDPSNVPDTRLAYHSHVLPTPMAQPSSTAPGPDTQLAYHSHILPTPMAQPSSTAPRPDTHPDAPAMETPPIIPIGVSITHPSGAVAAGSQLPHSFGSNISNQPMDTSASQTVPAPLPRSFGSNISNQPMDTSASQTVPAPEPENDENAASPTGQTVPAPEPENDENTASATDLTDRSARVRSVKLFVPAWLEVASKHIVDAVDADVWKALMSDWIQIESEHGATHTTFHRLPTSPLRPPLLSLWLPKRRYDQFPSVPDLQIFTNEWIAWWNSMQPVWRRSTTPHSLPLSLSSAQLGQNVHSLKKYGPNGLALVIVALIWWAPARTTDPRWEAAVLDVHSCVESYMSGSRKRKEGTGSGDSGEGKRQRR
ncbi:hypothetical protein BJ912DRAFT_1063879 [Pholiota molesta]|nr:hypothetical protein BJ912DRAFT_1070014 [Pholiota molesta]KAF8171898.1 hypothetical protein BJ912DRAFT_1065941 [Pholiota molesta]KAF8176563.1 hypothetical protein BJ912DRAFT_1063879 [Pholiota molesta]